MSVNENVPEIRFKGFSGEWFENDLGGLIDIRSAARVHKEQWTKAGVPFFRTSDVVSIYKGQENTKAYISHEVYEILSDKIGKVAKGDLLITGGGSIGIPYLVPNDDHLYFKDADLLWLKSNQKFDGYFFYTFFFSAPFKKHIKSISHTGTIAHYTIEQAKATPINTCDDQEQTQIGNTFQKLDSLINHHQQKHDKLSSIKKAMLEKMFPKPGKTIPEIRFKGFSGEWVEYTLGEIGSLKNGMNFDKTAMGHGYPFVNLQDVFGKNVVSSSNLGLAFSAESQRQDYSLNEGDVLFIRSSVKPEGVGEAAVVPEDMYNTTYSGFIIRFRPSIEMDVNFNRFVYSTTNCRKQILASSTSSANSNINQDSLQRIQLTLPCKSEQIQIGNYFQKLDTLINQHQQQITKLNNIKQACLRKMFV